MVKESVKPRCVRCGHTGDNVSPHFGYYAGGIGNIAVLECDDVQTCLRHQQIRDAKREFALNIADLLQSILDLNLNENELRSHVYGLMQELRGKK